MYVVRTYGMGMLALLNLGMLVGPVCSPKKTGGLGVRNLEL